MYSTATWDMVLVSGGALRPCYFVGFIEWIPSTEPIYSTMVPGTLTDDASNAKFYVLDLPKSET